MRMITIEEHIPGGPIPKACAKYTSGAAPYSVFASGKGLPYVPDAAIFDVCEKRVADIESTWSRYAGAFLRVSAPVYSTRRGRQHHRRSQRRIGRCHCEISWAFFCLCCSSLVCARESGTGIGAFRYQTGFKGAILSGRASSGKDFLDAPQFTPVLEAAQALNVPIYVHPAAPMLHVQQSYYDGLGDQLSARLSLYGWGWHHEAGIQVLRMILSGAFEKFPDLQLIAGHWGEMVPYFLSRLDQALPQSVTKLERTITETFRQNVYVTPSGIFDYPQLKFCAEVLGTDRIIHSVDSPFISNEGALPFIENAPIGDDDKEKIAHINAEKLFHLQ